VIALPYVATGFRLRDLDGGLAGFAVGANQSGAMKRYVIERDSPASAASIASAAKQRPQRPTRAGALLPARRSAGVVRHDDKTFCIYLADSEASVHEHAR